MKLKDLKRTRKALVKFMEQARSFDPLNTINMQDGLYCAYATITGDKWSVEAVAVSFKLLDKQLQGRLTPKLHESVLDLFSSSESLFAEPLETTWEEWLAVAAVTEAQLNLAIAKATHKKMKAKYEC